LRIIRIRKETINTALVWTVVFITGAANAITVSNTTLTVAMLLTVFIFFKRNLKIDRFFVIFTAVYFSIYLIHILKFDYVDFRELREFIKIVYAYAFVKLVHDKFFHIYVNLIYALALISLPLYVFQLIDYNAMKSIIGIVEHNISFLDYRDDWYENIFIFTVNDNAIYRNSGFAWEPKGFGTFLTLAFFIQLFLNGFKFFDKKNIVYLIAIGTTLSTATYGILLLGIIPFYLYNKGASFKVVSSLLIVPVILIAFTQLDFMSDKIVNEYETRDKYVGFVTDKTYEGESRSLGRFGSFIVDYRDFIKEPLIGYGLYSEERTMYSIGGVKLVRVNGFSDFLAKFGLVGMFFLIIYYFHSFKKISFQFNFKGYFIIPISILMTSLGSAILLNPLYLGFIFYGFIKTREDE